MLERLRHTAARWLLGRSYIAAAGGRRGSSIQSMSSPISAAHASRATIAARAKFVAGNNPLGAAAVMAWTAQAIGTGIKPSSLHASPRVREKLNKRFTAWTDVSDDEGRTDWYGQQVALLRSVIISGEALAVLLTTKAGLRVRILDPEQLDAAYNANHSDGGRVVQGVEFDKDGQRVAYHIFDHPPGVEFSIQRNRRRVPADDVIHCYRMDWPGQVRGMSFFAPALVRITDFEGWHDAQLMRQRVSALTTGFVITTDGTASPFNGEQKDDTVNGDMAPGAIRVLDPGQDYRESKPAQIGMDVVDFGVTVEREIAVALGLPAHAFGDVSKANYSSLKSANTAWKARVESLVWSMFVHQVCLPVWRRWVMLETLSGGVRTSLDAALPVKHICPTFPSLEPVKDATANTANLAAGLTTRRQLLAEMGEDIEEVDRILAEDNARAKALGLTFGTAPTPANDNEPAAEAA